MASGRPDWYGSMSMHGKFGNDYKPVAVDSEGNLVSIMTGMDGVDRVAIAVDDAGIMKANLALQDLDFLTVRPAYGRMVTVTVPITIGTGALTRIFYIPGQGILYDIMITSDCGNDASKFFVEYKADDDIVSYLSPFNLYERNIVSGSKYRLVLSEYNTVDHIYTVLNESSVTFEESFEVLIYQNTGGDVDIDIDLSYALTP